MKHTKNPTHSVDDSESASKTTKDVAMFLVTVIAGQAIIEALSQCFNASQGPSGFIPNWPYLLQCWTVVVTTLRFFHGNAMWYLSQDGPVPIQEHHPSKGHHFGHLFLLFNYYLHAIQYMLFFVAGKSVGHVLLEVEVFSVISVVDIFWTGFSRVKEKKLDLKDCLGVWLKLNCASGTITIALLILHFKSPACISDVAMSFILAATYSICALLDYHFNPKLYFATKKPIN